MRVQYQAFLAPNIISLLKSHLPEPPSDAEMERELAGIERLSLALSGCYPDGVTGADIDRACQGEQCTRCKRELNRDGSCDACDDQFDDEVNDWDYWERVDEAMEELRDAE